ncbi:MAG: hypothetical protein AAB697_00575 [Patescibacteria group bacterium]
MARKSSKVKYYDMALAALAVVLSATAVVMLARSGGGQVAGLHIGF